MSIKYGPFPEVWKSNTKMVLALNTSRILTQRHTKLLITIAQKVKWSKSLWAIKEYGQGGRYLVPITTTLLIKVFILSVGLSRDVCFHSVNSPSIFQTFVLNDGVVDLWPKQSVFKPTPLTPLSHQNENWPPLASTPQFSHHNVTPKCIRFSMKLIGFVPLFSSQTIVVFHNHRILSQKDKP